MALKTNNSLFLTGMKGLHEAGITNQKMGRENIYNDINEDLR